MTLQTTKISNGQNNADTQSEKMRQGIIQSGIAGMCYAAASGGSLILALKVDMILIPYTQAAQSQAAREQCQYLQRVELPKGALNQAYGACVKHTTHIAEQSIQPRDVAMSMLHATSDGALGGAAVMIAACIWQIKRYYQHQKQPIALER